MNFVDTTYCVACRKPMSASASVCPACGADQSAARAQPMPVRVQRDETTIANRAIAAVEVLGGLLGLFVVVAAIPRLPMGAILLSGGAFIVCLVSGIWLWKGETRGLRLSLAVQAMQSVVVAQSGLSYLFLAGPTLLLFLSLIPGSRIGFYWYCGLSSYLHLGTGRLSVPPFTRMVQPEGASVLGLNVVAFAFALYLARQVFAASESKPTRLP